MASSSTSQRGSALTLYSYSGLRLRRYFNVARAAALAEAWSPDSRFLAVVLSSRDPVSGAASGLAVIDASGLTYRIVAHGPIYGASFAPDGSNRIVYASAAGVALRARVDVHVVGADGSHRVARTRDGRSLNPVWGTSGIAFDRERLRTREAPAYQVWLMRADGSRARRLSHIRIPPLLDGLVPLGFSADGRRLLAEYVGLDTSEAWALTVADGRARELKVAGDTVTGEAISRSGAWVLVDLGGFLNPPDHGIIESVPFERGRVRTLIDHGADPSWNL